ncbi:hypothetical protein BpJC7_09990 [Weizmannia acidilactici]|uniref:Uncharacterized protein n=1 Tax=Weizmannia acidilactici TaxID=2607726 RepID=A0A5J4J3Y3_9BACI|nr:hypothetical protein BpJC4_16570 [Weizmannia acidilactici]GER69696.1 hypothetical protein BpJC7_09990 [Weizmannia acidilactici]GER72483.1 hypothetical protein BpPP18_05500 [Weizmannia acidilactici]
MELHNSLPIICEFFHYYPAGKHVIIQFIVKSSSGGGENTMRIHYIQHVPYEGSGTILDWAKENGHVLSHFSV